MANFKLICFSLAIVLCVSCAASTSVDNYIVGGRDAQPNQFPYLASLRTLAVDHFCGATIISGRWLVSAAHCTQNITSQPQNVLAYVGAHGRRDGTKHTLDRIVNHPHFNPIWLLNDVSLLRTTEAIQFTRGVVVPAQLPAADWNGQRVVLLVPGWGLTDVRNFDIIF